MIKRVREGLLLQSQCCGAACRFSETLRFFLLRIKVGLFHLQEERKALPGTVNSVQVSQADWQRLLHEETPSPHCAHTSKHY